jgi:hypothetical protein
MKHNIGVVINYCTNDYKFIKHTIGNVSEFAQQIIVPVCNHYYDGTIENSMLIEKTIRENPKAKFMKFKFDNKKKVEPYWLWRLRRVLKLPLQSGSQYWICYARMLGWKNMSKKMDYLLFLDADEIIDGKRFIKWLNTGKYQKLDVLKFANYWYFREPKYQATTYEDTPLMLKTNTINKESFFSYSEREGMYQKAKGAKKRMVLGLDNKPMVHHYGWTRTGEEMLKKVQTWGHNRDCDWVKLVEKEFTHKFAGTDFVQGYQYRTVKPFINL